MNWIKLRDKHPIKHGIYWVKIRTNSGGEKICKADWSLSKGFTPIAETIGVNEYVFEWGNIE